MTENVILWQLLQFQNIFLTRVMLFKKHNPGINFTNTIVQKKNVLLSTFGIKESAI